MQRYFIQISFLAAACLLAGCTGEKPPTGWKFKAGKNWYYDVERKVQLTSGTSQDQLLYQQETGYILLTCTSNDSARLKLSLKVQGSTENASVISFGYNSGGEVIVQNPDEKGPLQTMLDIWFPLPEKELEVGENYRREILITLGNTGMISNGSITSKLYGYVDIQGVRCAIIKTSFELSATTTNEKLGEISQRTEGEGVAHFALKEGCFFRSETMSRITRRAKIKAPSGANDEKPAVSEKEITGTQEEYTLIKLVRGN